MTTLVSSRYAGTDLDFLKAKVDRSGANRAEYFTLSVTSGSTVGTLLKLVPFQKGARFIQGASQFHVADLTTAASLTLDFGYTYNSTALTSDPDAFATALTTGQAGGLITFDEHAGLDWVATADGWITATVGGGPTSTTGALKGQAVLSYDSI